MTLFLRMLQDEDKASALDGALAAMRRGETDAHVFEVAPEDFAQVPGAPFAYWVSEDLRSIFSREERFESSERTAKQGLATADDFRFVRLWWEVAHQSLGKDWYVFAKGGAYSPFYADLHLVVNWSGKGRELGAFAGSVIRNPQFYFRPGLTWPLRSGNLSFRAVPAGGVFGHKGPCAFVHGDPQQGLLALIAVCSSKAFGYLVRLQTARTELAQSFEVGLIQQTPVPALGAEEIQLAEHARQAWSIKRSLDTATETSHAFWLPALLQGLGSTLEQRAAAWNEKLAWGQRALESIQSEIDDIAFRLYGISEEDRRAMEQGTALAASSEDATDAETDEADEDEGDTAGSDASTLVGQLLSWCVGVAFGRWDLRCATGEREAPPEPDPFDPLPSRAPGAPDLALRDGSSASSSGRAGEEWLLDDPGDHSRDLVAKVEEVLASLQGTSDWVGEACRILGVRDLRDWFRRRFFDLHLKAYSKSRRKAPLYWPLSVPSGRFAVWLYAPAIHKDSLWRVLQEVAKPRLELESRRYWDLKGEVGDAPSRDQVRELDERESLVRELQRFVADLEQAAPLWNPNLDDGTVLCAAVLHRLFQHNGWRKECETKWRDLEALKYPWAHISLHLWPERVLPLCHRDRSLAIAHDLEEDFWEQDKDENWKPRKLDAAALQALSARFRSATVGSALQSFGAARLDASGDSSPKIKATRGRKPKAAKPEQMGLGLE